MRGGRLGGLGGELRDRLRPRLLSQRTVLKVSFFFLNYTANLESVADLRGLPTGATDTNTNTNTNTAKPTETDQQVSTNNKALNDFVGTSRSAFSRTVWLPRPVDAKNVQANLDHGVLTLRIPKAAEGTTRIPIL